MSLLGKLIVKLTILFPKDFRSSQKSVPGIHYGIFYNYYICEH